MGTRGDSRGFVVHLQNPRFTIGFPRYPAATHENPWLKKEFPLEHADICVQLWIRFWSCHGYWTHEQSSGCDEAASSTGSKRVENVRVKLINTIIVRSLGFCWQVRREFLSSVKRNIVGIGRRTTRETLVYPRDIVVSHGMPWDPAAACGHPWDPTCSFL